MTRTEFVRYFDEAEEQLIGKHRKTRLNNNSTVLPNLSNLRQLFRATQRKSKTPLLAADLVIQESPIRLRYSTAP